MTSRWTDDTGDEAGVTRWRPRRAARRRQLRPTDVKRLNREWRRRTEGRLALLLDSVSQPFNVGSIVRTAAAFGVESVWLCGNTPDLDLPAVGKTALGTDRFLSAYRSRPRRPRPRPRRRTGSAWWPSSSRRARCRCSRRHWTATSAWRSGTRTTAAPPPCSAAVSSAAYIPQVGRVGSLNVAVAAAIALGEARRREWTSPGGLRPPGLSSAPRFLLVTLGIRRRSPASR